MIIIGEREQQKRSAVGVVIGGVNGRYQVCDDSGRVHQAESAASWRIGSRVTVIDGQITGAAGTQPKNKVYEV